MNAIVKPNDRVVPTGATAQRQDDDETGPPRSWLWGLIGLAAVAGFGVWLLSSPL